MEALEERIPCTRRLRRGESLHGSVAFEFTLLCCAGSVEIAVQEAAVPAFVLTEGERFAVRRGARLTVRFHAGHKNEWLADTGSAVLAFLAGLE